MENKEYVYRAVYNTYKEELEGHPRLTRAKFKAVICAYGEGIKAGMQTGALIRLDTIGSFQPQKIRSKRNSLPPDEIVLDSKPQSTYLCSVNESKPLVTLNIKDYGTYNESTDAQNIRSTIE